MTHNNHSANYTYLAKSDLVSSVVGKNNTTPVLTTTKHWDFGMRLRSIDNSTSSGPVSSFHYAYDSLNRRVRATMADGSYWRYGYNDRGELISGVRYWSDFTPVSGQQFHYGFDNIGNRTLTKAGGDSYGGNLRSSTYTANNLNQITQRTVPGYADIIGAAYADSTVTVNDNIAGRRGEYYQHALAISNGGGPVWQLVTNKAVRSASTTTEVDNLLHPPATQTLSYDLDGNLTNDSLWQYTWDGENRLVEVTSHTSVDTSARKKIEFEYDNMGRRIQKVVYSWSGGGYSSTPDENILFVYDPAGGGGTGGWNLLAELNKTNHTVLRSYVWGKDLGGELDTAGGIGGLVIKGSVL